MSIIKSFSVGNGDTFYIEHNSYNFKGCNRRWMNQSDSERQSSGIEILWPDLDNQHFTEALAAAENGESPNDISAVIKYSVREGATVLWMGDLETEFMELIEDDL